MPIAEWPPKGVKFIAIIPDYMMGYKAEQEEGADETNRLEEEN